MSDTIVKGKVAVADHFGVSERQVRRWGKDPDFPKLSGRRFDLLQIQAWRDRKDGQAAPRPAAPADPRQPLLSAQSGKDFEDARMKRARANLLELDLKQRRGELVPLQEVEKMHEARIMAVKQGLLSLSRALPPQLVVCQTEREMEPVIAKAVRNLLESFARPLPENLTAGAPMSASPEVAQGG